MIAHDQVNILLVDDQPGKLLAYEAMLSPLGEHLIRASSGREALEHLLRTDITVVLMDVSMPELDGFELADIIRQHPRFQKTAIIFVSAVHLSDLDRLKGYESGAVDYVSVPVIPEILRAKVSVFTDLYRKTRESERLTRELEQRVAERTAALEASTAELSRLASELQAADRRKDEFLALARARVAQPAGPGAQCHHHSQAEADGRPGRGVVPRRDRAPVRSADAAGRRPARRLPHHAGQDQAASGAASTSPLSSAMPSRPAGRSSTPSAMSSSSSCPRTRSGSTATGRA